MIAVAILAFLFGVALTMVVGVALLYKIERSHFTDMREVMHKTIDTQIVSAKTQLEGLIRLTTTGQSTMPPAVVQEREPDLVERASRLVSEQTIAAGVQMLKAEYQRLGITMSDEELNDEALLILGALGPAIPQR